MLLGLAGCISATAPITLPPTGSELHSATVKVSYENGHGSGVLIAPDLVLTAKHVVEDTTDKLTVGFDSGDTVAAHVAWGSDDYDVAVIQLDTKSTIKPASVRCSPVKAGEPVTVMGYPLSLTQVETHGWVASETPKNHNIVLDVTIAPGSSGGPVYDGSGKVIGTATAILLAPIGPYPSILRLSYMTPVSPSVCNYLNASR